jgi:hypothetical protein
MDALEKAGCERIFVETESGTKADRVELDIEIVNLSAEDAEIRRFHP